MGVLIPVEANHIGNMGCADFIIRYNRAMVPWNGKTRALVEDYPFALSCLFSILPFRFFLSLSSFLFFLP